MNKKRMPGIGHRRTCEDQHQNHSSEAFPTCQLHDIRIVDRFPRGCPFAAPIALRALFELRKRGFLLTGNRDYGEGAHLLEVADTCSHCIDENIAHPVVQRLRGLQ